MMKQRWGLDRNNVVRPTPGDPSGVEHGIPQQAEQIFTLKSQSFKKAQSQIAEKDLAPHS